MLLHFQLIKNPIDQKLAIPPSLFLLSREERDQDRDRRVDLFSGVRSYDAEEGERS